MKLMTFKPFPKILSNSAMIIICALLMSLIISHSTVIKAQIADTKAEVAKIENFSFATKEQIPSTDLYGIDDPYSSIADINEFWGSDGNYHIVFSGARKVYISVLNPQMELVKTLVIPKVLSLVGNVIQDEKGDYYIVYGEPDTSELSDENVGTKTVLTVAQYSGEGELLNTVSYTGNDTCPYDGITWGTKTPFAFGNCDLIIDKKGILVCRYGRVMYSGHQSSHTLYINTSTMTKINYISPYVSHSFDQRVLETSDGDYLFAERGDAYPRGISISKITSTTDDIWSYPSFTPFHFRNGYIYQTTYASIADITECSNRYVLAGASEKTLSYETAAKSYFNESRNIFMQVFSKNFSSSSTNDASVQLLQGENRFAEGTYKNGIGLCQPDAKDYGILWLTNYTGTYYASNPKLVNIGNDQLLIMWEKKNYNDSWEDTFIESYYMVVSSDGKIIIPQTVIQDERMTQYGEPDYKDGCIYWATSDGESCNFIVHRLTIGETMSAKIHVSSLHVDQKNIIAHAGEKTSIKVSITPSNADNKKLKFKDYDTDIIEVDKEGHITVKSVGATNITIYSEDNESIYTDATIYTTDSAPTNLKVSRSGDSVKLSWNKTLFGSEYQIYRSTNKNKGYECIGYSYDLSYIDDALFGKVYYYKVKSSNNWWDEDFNQNPFSSPVMFYLQSSPNQFKLEKHTNTSVKITWTKVNAASGYQIYYYDLETKKYKLLKDIQGNSTFAFIKYGLIRNQTYLFKIRAYKIIDGVYFYSSFHKATKITL